MAGPEARIRDRYRKEATRLGYLVLVLHGSVYSGPGRADTLTLAGGNWIAIEFKTEVGKPTPMQLAFLRAVRDAGGYGFIARMASAALAAVRHITRGVCPYEEKGADDDMELDLDFLDKLDVEVVAIESPVTTGTIYVEPVDIGFPPESRLYGDPRISQNPPAIEAPKKRRARTPKPIEAVLPETLTEAASSGVQDGYLYVPPSSINGTNPDWAELMKAIRQLTWEITALREELANHRLVEAGRT